MRGQPALDDCRRGAGHVLVGTLPRVDRHDRVRGCTRVLWRRGADGVHRDRALAGDVLDRHDARLGGHIRRDGCACGGRRFHAWHADDGAAGVHGVSGGLGHGLWERMVGH